MKNLKGYWDELHQELKINNDMIVMKAEYESVASFPYRISLEKKSE